MDGRRCRVGIGGPRSATLLGRAAGEVSWAAVGGAGAALGQLAQAGADEMIPAAAAHVLAVEFVVEAAVLEGELARVVVQRGDREGRLGSLPVPLKVHSTTVQRTVVGGVASSTRISSGGWPATIGNRSSPSVSPEPVTGLHQAVSAAGLVTMPNATSAGAFTRTVVRYSVLVPVIAASSYGDYGNHSVAKPMATGRLRQGLPSTVSWIVAAACAGVRPSASPGTSTTTVTPSSISRARSVCDAAAVA